MVFLASDELAILNLITLIAAILVQWRNDVIQIGAFLDGLDSVLTLRSREVVKCAFEDESETFGHEADLVGLTPAEKEQSNLPNTIVL